MANSAGPPMVARPRQVAGLRLIACRWRQRLTQQAAPRPGGNSGSPLCRCRGVAQLAERPGLQNQRLRVQFPPPLPVTQPWCGFIVLGVIACGGESYGGRWRRERRSLWEVALLSSSGEKIGAAALERKEQRDRVGPGRALPQAGRFRVFLVFTAPNGRRSVAFLEKWGAVGRLVSRFREEADGVDGCGTVSGRGFVEARRTRGSPQRLKHG